MPKNAGSLATIEKNGIGSERVNYVVISIQAKKISEIERMHFFKRKKDQYINALKIY